MEKDQAAYVDDARGGEGVPTLITKATLTSKGKQRKEKKRL